MQNSSEVKTNFEQLKNPSPLQISMRKPNAICTDNWENYDGDYDQIY